MPISLSAAYGNPPDPGPTWPGLPSASPAFEAVTAWAGAGRVVRAAESDVATWRLPRVRDNALLVMGRAHAEITAALLAILATSCLAAEDPARTLRPASLPGCCLRRPTVLPTWSWEVVGRMWTRLRR
ncbi:hypothetical protein GCM10023176_34050 [Micromonospora coerulea]|uniref:Uncharacterized protein n=1 Tax=Micromonospora coerulea TaxID=47856 RepID=A0ABP8SPE0_9ACTN